MHGVRDLGPAAIRDNLRLMQFCGNYRRPFGFQQACQPLGDHPVDVGFCQPAVTADRSGAGLGNMAGIKAYRETLEGQGRSLCMCRNQRDQEFDTDDHPNKQPGQERLLLCFYCSENGEKRTESHAGPESEPMGFKKQGDQAAEEGAERQDEQAL